MEFRSEWDSYIGEVSKIEKFKDVSNLSIMSGIDNELEIRF